MKLAPTNPPGRITRKARSFEAEIVQLREQGYTLAAIRLALADAGVHVSLSTVRREACRRDVSKPLALAGRHAPDVQQPLSLSPAPSKSSAPQQRSGKEIAEAFVRNQNTNPLIRAKDQP